MLQGSRRYFIDGHVICHNIPLWDGGGLQLINITGINLDKDEILKACAELKKKYLGLSLRRISVSVGEISFVHVSSDSSQLVFQCKLCLFHQ